MKTIDGELSTTGREIRDTADRRPVPRWHDRRRRMDMRVAIAAAAAVLLIAAIGIPVLWLRSSDQLDRAADAPPPADFGTWREMAEAPIVARPNAVSVWTGTEAVFWAGSSLNRGFAYTDGAAYDPLSDTWRHLAVPGWGHPGLSGVFFDGELYALAKGGGTRLNPSDGTWTDLPPVAGMYLSAAVATDQAVWGLGPAATNPGGQPDIAIARFDPEGDRWIYGPVFDGTSEIGALFEDLLFLEQPVLWTGSEIVLWDPDGGGLAFNPTTEVWQRLAVPVPPSGVLATSRATVAGSSLVAVAEVTTDGASSISVATHRDGSWTWRDLGITFDDFAAVTVAAASDWVVLLAPNRAPIVFHAPSGAWTQAGDGPLAGLQSPNVVWTGDGLVIWGGIGSPTASNLDPAQGAVWTPPAG